MFISRFHNKQNYRTPALLAFLFIASSYSLPGQADKKFIRQGNREFGKNNYSDSEISYRKALDKNKESADAVFNVGDALYKQKKYEDAGKEFLENHSMSEEKGKKSASLYNLGNSLLMSNKIKESIEAYENSLKLDPLNMEAKFNLAYAQDLLQKQQQQQQQQQNDQNKNQDKKDQNKDQQNNQDKKNQNQDQQKDQQQQKQQDQQISKADAERILNALANDEKKVQEKVKLDKAMKEKVRTVINW